MNKTIKLAALTSSMIVGSIAAQPVVNGNYLAIYRSPWHMVKDLFITQPNKESKKYHTTLRGCIKSAVYGLGTTAGLFAFHNLILAPLFGQPKEQIDEREMDDMSEQPSGDAASPMERNTKRLAARVLAAERPSMLELLARTPFKKQMKIYPVIGTLITNGGILYKIAERFYKGPKFYRAEQFKIMEIVLERWHEVKSYFPESIQPMFDTLHYLRKTESPDYISNIEQALEVIKTEVAIHAR